MLPLHRRGTLTARRYRFAPIAIASPVGDPFCFSEGDRGGWDYALSPPSTVDIHGDGRAELIATYELEVNLERVEVPVVMGWDDRSQRYVISALLPGRQPSVRRAGGLGGPGPGVEVDPFYTGAYKLADRVRARACAPARSPAEGLHS